MTAKRKRATTTKRQTRLKGKSSNSRLRKKAVAKKSSAKKAEAKRKGSSAETGSKKKRDRVPREPRRLMPDEVGIVNLWRWLSNRLAASLMLVGSIDLDGFSSIADAPPVIQEELRFLEKLNKLRIRYEEEIVIDHHGKTPITRARLWMALWQRVLAGHFQHEKSSKLNSASERDAGRMEVLRVLQEYIGITPTQKDVEVLLNESLSFGGEQEAQEVINKSSYGIGRRGLDDVIAWLNREGGMGDPGLELAEDDARRGPVISKPILLNYFLKFILRLDDSQIEGMMLMFNELYDPASESIHSETWEAFQAYLRELQSDK